MWGIGSMGVPMSLRVVVDGLTISCLGLEILGRSGIYVLDFRFFEEAQRCRGLGLQVLSAQGVGLIGYKVRAWG